MGFVSQQLAQANPASTDAVTILFPQTGKTIEIKTIMLANTTKNEAGIWIYQHNLGSTYDESTCIIPPRPIPGYGMVLVEGWFPMNNPDGNLAVKQTVPSAITVTVWGAVI